MEYYLNFFAGGQSSVSAEQPDKKADITITIRSGSQFQIGEILTSAKQYLGTHDVMLEAVTGSINRLVTELGYKHLNTTIVSSILKKEN